MRRKSASSGTFSGSDNQSSTNDFSIYDVPNANLDARHEARELLKHPDPEVQAAAQRIIDKLTLAIRAMGREDLGLLLVADEAGDQQIDAQPAA